MESARPPFGPGASTHVGVPWHNPFRFATDYFWRLNQLDQGIKSLALPIMSYVAQCPLWRIYPHQRRFAHGPIADVWLVLILEDELASPILPESCLSGRRAGRTLGLGRCGHQPTTGNKWAMRWCSMFAASLNSAVNFPSARPFWFVAPAIDVPSSTTRSNRGRRNGGIPCLANS